MQKIGEILDKIETGFYVTVVLFCTLLMFINVILRYFFNSGIIWSEELIRYAMIWLSFFAIGYAVRGDRHVKIDFFAYFLPERWKNMLFAITDIISAVFCAFMVKYSFELVLQQYGAAQKSPSLQVPFYIVSLSMALGFLIGFLRFVQDAVVKAKRGVKGC